MTLKLVETAKRIALELRDTVAEDNRLRRLSDRTWKILLGNGFLRSLQSARWGGGEVPLVDYIDAMMEIARVSPSAGWVAGIIGVHPWQLALFDEKAQRDIWGNDPTAMNSSSYNPTCIHLLLRFVSAAILCIGVCLIAIPAQSQQNAGGTPASIATTISEGWWPSDRFQTALAIPRLEVGVANLTRFETPQLPPSSAAKGGIYPSNEYVNELSGQVDSELTRDIRQSDISALAEGGSLVAGSFFSVLSSQYEAWESSLSDSRSLTNVNGALVYPLIEITYTHWRMPISLYIPPLRGSLPR
ncbi:MAG: hypothetical protein JOZ29_09700 [Deltaproteobacteria bacterium]|nr:hypothetical protein [Deltaproteobacteria bacterium]